MKQEIKETLLKALMQYQGDSLERAQHAFKGLSDEEMQQEYGQSGQTRQEILDGYKAHRERVEEARAWVESQ